MRRETKTLFEQWKLLRLAVDLVEAQIAESCRDRAQRTRQKYSNRRKEFREMLSEAIPYKCAHCGTAEGDLTVDHIQPISLGGRNVLSNMQWLCANCNTRKASDLAEHWRWLRKQAGYTKPDGIPATVQIVIDTASQHAAAM